MQPLKISNEEYYKEVRTIYLEIAVLILAMASLFFTINFYKRQYSREFISDFSKIVIIVTEKAFPSNDDMETEKEFRRIKNRLIFLQGLYEKKYLNKKTKKLYLDLTHVLEKTVIIDGKINRSIFGDIIKIATNFNKPNNYKDSSNR